MVAAPSPRPEMGVQPLLSLQLLGACNTPWSPATAFLCLTPGPCCFGKERDIARGGALPPGFSLGVPMDTGDLETQREFCACTHFGRMSVKVFCVRINAKKTFKVLSSAHSRNTPSFCCFRAS